MESLEKTAHEHLKPYPHPAWRENIEVLLVTAAVVLALRTFLFQPMAIPSGSAQPTLWGIVSENLRGRADVQLPGRLERLVGYWWSGIRYYHVVARNDGVLTGIEDPKTVLPFVKRQKIWIENDSYTIWFPPEKLRADAGLQEGQRFRKGDDIIKLRVKSGDHLFVDRLTYNFRRPNRGEIIVFSSEGIPGLIPNTHYIKRLIAIGEDRVRIGNDRHVVINNERFDASTPGFEMVYGFDPKEPPRTDHYSGHVNDLIAIQNGRPPRALAPLFPNERAEFVVTPNHYLAFGDNTMNSHDGRAWGDFPREKVVGKAAFVFWPISERFGWAFR